MYILLIMNYEQEKCTTHIVYKPCALLAIVKGLDRKLAWVQSIIFVILYIKFYSNESLMIDISIPE
jgi:hypothetical protein